MRYLPLVVIVSMLSIGLVNRAARGEDAPASQPSTSPAQGVIEAKETQALKDAAGKTVTVHGKISGTFKPSSGVLLLNFEGARRGFSIAIPKDSIETIDKAFGGDVGANLKDKSINVTGEIKLYKDRPEIEVTKADQIVVVEEEKDK